MPNEAREIASTRGGECIQGSCVTVGRLEALSSKPLAKVIDKEELQLQALHVNTFRDPQRPDVRGTQLGHNLGNDFFQRLS